MQKPPLGWNPVGDHEIIVSLADIAAMQRDSSGLSTYAPRAEAVSAELGHALYHAVSLRALGILDWLHHDYSQAAARLGESCAEFQRLGTRWQVGRTFFDLGELSAEMHHAAEARAYFLHALSAFEALNVHPYAAQTRQHLAALSA